MSVGETTEGPVDLGGGCDGNCVGCGSGAPEAAEAAATRKPAVAPEIRLARLAFVLGALVGLGVASLLGAVVPAALPFVGAAALVVVALAAIVAVRIRPARGAGRA